MTAIATLPGISVEVGGSALPDADLLCVEEIVVAQKLSAPAMCELSFLHPAREPMACGESLRILIGPRKEIVFSGDVTAVEHEYDPGGWKIRVRAYDRLARLRKRKSVKAHVQVSLHDLASEMAADFGLTVAGSADTPLWQRYIQYRQNDLDCLLELADHAGLFLTLRGDVLHLLTLEGDDSSKRLKLGEDLLEASLVINNNEACESAAVQGWDPSHVSKNEGSASSPRLVKRPGVPSGAAGEHLLVHEATPDPSHATALAQAELDYRAASEVSLRGLAEGDPGLQPGGGITVEGGVGVLAGDYVLTEVTHTLDRERGYVTEISSAVPPRRPRVTGFLTVPATVTRIDDPESLGRIRVALTACNGLETDWMCVVSPGAGKKKGCMTLPDAGDTVLVCCSAENPAYGVVLGPVYGADGMPDTGIEAGAVARYTLCTPNGQRVQLDDAKKTIRFENSAGSYVELTPDRVTVHAATDLTLEAPGRSILIQANAIDFHRA
jgi:phage protein D/phage baseplate assembly protein gpV